MFRDLVIARVVEPTSLLDTGRVLRDLGRAPASYATMKRTLAPRRRRRQATATRSRPLCFAARLTSGDVSLVLYDVTTLYFEAEKEDDLRKVGYSKERRVDPQIVVGLLVDRHGFPLEIGCFEGNKAETATIVPIVKAVPGPPRPRRHGRGRRRRDAVGEQPARARRGGPAVHRRLPGDQGARSTWPPTSAGTATRSPTGSSSTPSPRRHRPTQSENNPTLRGRTGLGPRRSIPGRGGRCGPTRPSAPPATARP